MGLRPKFPKSKRKINWGRETKRVLACIFFNFHRAKKVHVKIGSHPWNFFKKCPWNQVFYPWKFSKKCPWNPIFLPWKKGEKTQNWAWKRKTLAWKTSKKHQKVGVKIQKYPWKNPENCQKRLSRPLFFSRPKKKTLAWSRERIMEIGCFTAPIIC